MKRQESIYLADFFLSVTGFQFQYENKLFEDEILVQDLS